MDASAFSPYETLAQSLLPFSFDAEDASHDVGHLFRVWKHAREIQAGEGGDLRIICAAVMLHDCVTVEKDSPLRSQASRLSAKKARGILSDMGWNREDIGQVCHAIEAHSFSAGIEPLTLEAIILQEADRLDAMGMVGVARCFHVAGRLNRGLYDPYDPQAQHRELDELAYTIDHFQTKMLKLADLFKTATGRAMAKARHERMELFLEMFLQEI